MKETLRRLGRAALRVTKRFLSNKPANNYEKVVFGAVREMAFTFGRAATA